jgi:HK97 family phage portal protein
MGVPSVLINDTAGSTVWGSGIGQLVEGFYKLNLRPYLERIEASMMLHLMPERDYDSYSLEFDFDSLLRADLATRLNTNSAAINSGQMTPNEARATEGRDPKDGGDDIYLNSTLVKAGQPTYPAPDQDNSGGLNEEIQT